jgi:hypothetical protein
LICLKFLCSFFIRALHFLPADMYCNLGSFLMAESINVKNHGPFDKLIRIKYPIMVFGKEMYVGVGNGGR